MEENKFVKTLIYYFGEILLIVVGILIALQIGAWNDNAKRLEEEIAMLENFSHDLKSDLVNLDINLHAQQISQSSLNHIINHCQNEFNYHDTLDKHFGWSMAMTYFINKTSSISALNSVGVDLISSHKIRNQIIRHYEVTYEFLKSTESSYNQVILDASKELFTSRFDQFLKADWTKTPIPDVRMKPINFDALKKDPEFEYFILSLNNQKQAFITAPYLQARIELKSLISAIDEELKRLQ